MCAYTHLCHAHTHIGCISDKRLHPSASRRGRGGCPRPHGSGAAAAGHPAPQRRRGDPALTPDASEPHRDTPPAATSPRLRPAEAAGERRGPEGPPAAGCSVPLPAPLRQRNLRAAARLTQPRAPQGPGCAGGGGRAEGRRRRREGKKGKRRREGDLPHCPRRELGSAAAAAVRRLGRPLARRGGAARRR